MGENNCSDCLQIKNLNDKITSICQQIEKSEKQRNDHEKRIAGLESETNELKVQFKNMKELLEKIDAKLDKLAEVPAQKWDKATTAVMIAMISVIVGATLGKLF